MKKLLRLPLTVLIFTTVMSNFAYAKGIWQVGMMGENAVAISPSKRVTLEIIKPKDGIWGHFIIPLTPEHTEKLRKHRITPHYSFVPAFITIDKIERRSTGKVNEYKHYISIDVDGRQWGELKTGSKLIIELPDGTQYEESLKGSFKAIKQVEKRLY